MTGRKSLWVAALTIALASPALAQESVRHVYAGGMFGQSHWRSACPTQTSCDDTDRALRAFAGYQINKTFAAEIGFDNLGKATGNDSNVKGTAWEAVAVAEWPLISPISVYGKLGIFRGNAKGSGSLTGAKETNYGPTFAVGAQFDFSRNLAVRLDWQSYPGLGGSTLPKTDVNVLSAGALWRFR